MTDRRFKCFNQSLDVSSSVCLSVLSPQFLNLDSHGIVTQHFISSRVVLGSNI